MRELTNMTNQEIINLLNGLEGELKARGEPVAAEMLLDVVDQVVICQECLEGDTEGYLTEETHCGACGEIFQDIQTDNNGEPIRLTTKEVARMTM